MSHMLRLFARSSVALAILLLFPLCGLGYVQGDINSDDRIGLEETIFSLKVLNGTATALSGNTITVPGDIPSIQQAIDAASDGDTIAIAAGTYTEQLYIGNKYVILTGAGSSSTFIDGGGVNDVIAVFHGAAILNDLTVQNGKRGIRIIDRSYVETHGVMVKNCTDQGLQLSMNSNGRVFDSSFNTNGRDGVYVGSSSYLQLSGTVATNGNTRDGLRLFQAGTVQLDTATFTSANNGSKGISVHFNSTLQTYNSSITVLDNPDSGIGVFNTSSLLLDQGSITIQRVPQGSGLSISESSHLLSIGDILVTDTYYSGLNISNGSSVNIRGKLEVLRSSENGIGLFRSASLTSNDTATIKISNSALTGITVSENSLWRASGGNITIENNAADAGIGAYRNSTVSLRNTGAGLTCLLTGNKIGIDLSQSSVVRGESGLTITSNLDSGVNSSRNGDIDLRHVSITRNGNFGINADSDTVLRLENTTVSGNTNGNVQLSFGSSSSISGPTLPATNLICDSTIISRGDKVCP